MPLIARQSCTLVALMRCSLVDGAAVISRHQWLLERQGGAAADGAGDANRGRQPTAQERGRCSAAALRSVHGDDFGVVDEPVDHGSGDDLVAEDFAPAAEWLVGGDDQRGSLIAAGDELEEQVCRLGFEGNVADLVDLCGYPHRSTYADTATMPRRGPWLVRGEAVAGSGCRHSYRLSRNASVLSAGR
jgi:hypothetical protein